MRRCFFITDLHGRIDRYDKFFDIIAKERPDAVFMGGDLLPSGTASLASAGSGHRDFINDYLAKEFIKLKDLLAENYPRVFVILGNDDSRAPEATMLEVASRGIWDYIHNRHIDLGDYQIYGYTYVPPTPFQLKDWERYDVSRYVDPDCISPENGLRTTQISDYSMKYTTIAKDLKQLAGNNNLDKAVFLFHTPPHQTNLDCIDHGDRMIDHATLDKHVGSVAVKKFIESRQPLITLHGHIHESARLTGFWENKIGRTFCFSAAHDGSELALVRFDLECPENAKRELI